MIAKASNTVAGISLSPPNILHIIIFWSWFDDILDIADKYWTAVFVLSLFFRTVPNFSGSIIQSTLLTIQQTGMFQTVFILEYFWKHKDTCLFSKEYRIFVWIYVWLNNIFQQIRSVITNATVFHIRALSSGVGNTWSCYEFMYDRCSSSFDEIRLYDT